MTDQPWKTASINDGYNVKPRKATAFLHHVTTVGRIIVTENPIIVY